MNVLKNLILLSIMFLILSCSTSRYTNLNRALSNADEVKILDLSRDQLKKIPEGVFELKNLEELILFKNNIKEFHQIKVSNKGSQFRSRDFYPQAVVNILKDQKKETLGKKLPVDSIANIPKNKTLHSW